MENDIIFNKIAEALLVDYTSVYYVNARTNEYKWFSIDPKFHALQIEQGGKDFFANLTRDVQKVVHEDDRHIFLTDINKEFLLTELQKGEMHSVEYRLMIDGKPVYHKLRLIKEADNENEYFILGVINVDKEVRERQERARIEKEKTVYNQIADTLASKYDMIYYVNSVSGNYMEFTANTLYGSQGVVEEGFDFFKECYRNAEQLVHPDDLEKVRHVLTKKEIFEELKKVKKFVTDYRLLIDGYIEHTRMSIMWSSDRIHFIVGVENINDEVNREKEHAEALRSANEMARRDILTGIKNKSAYTELETTVQNNIDNGIDYFPFALVVCDVNDLKMINDTQGHSAGDEYIKSSCKIICDIFEHSPVFRVGGDEFAVFVAERDYMIREELFTKLRDIVKENKKTGNGPIIASGMSDFVVGSDKKIKDVFNRADKQMYENKRNLKENVV